MTWQEVAQKHGNAHQLDSTHRALAEEILRLQEENEFHRNERKLFLAAQEKMRTDLFGGWAGNHKENIDLKEKLAHSESKRAKLRELLYKMQTGEGVLFVWRHDIKDTLAADAAED